MAYLSPCGAIWVPRDMSVFLNNHSVSAHNRQKHSDWGRFVCKETDKPKLGTLIGDFLLIDDKYISFSLRKSPSSQQESGRPVLAEQHA